MSADKSPDYDDEAYDKMRKVLEDEKVTVTVGEHGMTATNAQPSKYGRWVNIGNSYVFKLNKKGKHRIARRGEL